MNPEDHLQQMLNRARGEGQVTESKWNEFATSARRSLRIQRFATVGVTALLVAAATVGGVAALGTRPAMEPRGDGCDSDVGPIAESTQFTPYGQRLSYLASEDVAITDGGGQAVTSSERRVDGLPLRWQVGDGVRSSYQYFLETELDRQLTVPGFLAAGGIQLDRDLVTDGDPYTAADVIAQVGDRAVKVQIGDYEGALVWADPENNGARPHHLYWSDGTYNYALIAVRDPQRMVQLGRELVCGG
ncbi:MAG TPA: hypothetical protein VEV82_09190 [Actinomycetota bacterium]|nr:hypothetical protein [Actinomycetota bacterium]